jgi:preprotein translocase subunit SecG
MTFFIGLLTFILVLDCLVLVLLVLVQLPKKEAGAGLAFGGAASDALFGAGSGTVLTKVTKYAATVFFALAIFLGILQSRFAHRSGSEFQRMLDLPMKAAATTGVSTSALPASTTAGTNALLRTTPSAEAPVTSVPAPVTAPATTTSAPAPANPETPR